MTPSQLEQAVFALEEIRIVVRAAPREQLGDFGYNRRAAGNSTVNEWMENRLKPITNGHEIVVLDGNCRTAHGRTKMETLRQSYER